MRSAATTVPSIRPGAAGELGAQPTSRWRGTTRYVRQAPSGPAFSVGLATRPTTISPATVTARVCNVPGCPKIVRRARGGRCTSCERKADAARGSSSERGYDSEHRSRFRAAVLARDSRCVLCGQAVSTVADHYPQSRRELVELGLDANDPRYGRGLCRGCHAIETARWQPGGWAAQEKMIPPRGRPRRRGPGRRIKKIPPG